MTLCLIMDNTLDFDSKPLCANIVRHLALEIIVGRARGSPVKTLHTLNPLHAGAEAAVGETEGAHRTTGVHRWTSVGQRVHQYTGS